MKAYSSKTWPGHSFIPFLCRSLNAGVFCFAFTLLHSHRDDEPITPHQITFLKLVDSNLRHPLATTSLHDYSFLPEAFQQLCSYSQHSIRNSLGQDARPFEPQSQADIDHTNSIVNIPNQDLKELDLRLPKVFAALVLLSQCITTILLQVQDAGNGEASNQSGYFAVLGATQASGFIETLIGEGSKIYASCALT